jgi:hypothetical protein
MANAILLEPLAMTAIAADSTASGYAAGNLGSDWMGLVWRSATGASSRSVTVDLGSDRPVTAIMVLGLAGAQPGWDWSIDLATAAQGAFSGSYWSGSAQDLLAGSQMPVSGLGRALWQAPDGAPAAARHVRINFLSLASAAVQASRLVIAEAVQLDRNFRFGAAFGVRSLGTLEFSARGVMLRRKGKKLRGVGISFPHIHRDEVEAKVQPLLERVGTDTPIGLVIDPAADAQRQNRMYFGPLTGDLGTVWARPGGFQADFNLIALD